MDRYSYLQAMPNSPLTPLTPLSENTQFEFNIRGDGSLDEYIDSVLQEHRVEQQRKKLLEQANQPFQKKLRPALPRRYSEEFLKIREVFEGHNHQFKQLNCYQHKKPPKTQKHETLQTKQNRVFVKASPVAAKPLCSQVANILHQCGLAMYYGVFQREEIDLLAFRLLRLQDLHDLGIKNQSHCAVLMKSVHYVRQYLIKDV